MKTLIIVSYLLFCHSTNAQKTNAATNGANSLADSVYIPIDLNDCLKQLDSIFVARDKTKIKALTEHEFSWNYPGLGMWMRNNWGLRKGSRLSKYFNSIGIADPLDMTGIIFDSYHRQLTGKEIKLDEQIKRRKDDFDRKTKKFASYHINDTVTFFYSYGFISKAQEKKSANGGCIAKGIITGKRDTVFTIKVRLLDACDKKGIVSSDNKGSLIYNKSTEKFEQPEERIIEYMKPGEELWFNYFDWQTKD